MNPIQSLLTTQPRDEASIDLSPFEANIENSISYLNSADAFLSIERNPYWPKWHSPWWHMSVLFEMGLADEIPKRIATTMLSAIKETQLPYFFREEAPSDKASHQEAPCPCSLGNIYQILNAVGMDFDSEVPWARGWFLKYQMLDGGMSCDEDAYKADANASSIVGTISPLEALLSRSELSPEEKNFLDRGALCLLSRELRLGSSSVHNQAERFDEEDWLKPCFPRFYFYDVLRGLNFILNWAERLNGNLPAASIEAVVKHLSQSFPDGKIRAQRHSYEGCMNYSVPGDWTSRQEASRFPLLLQISEIQTYSPFLTKNWRAALRAIDRLSRSGQIS